MTLIWKGWRGQWEPMDTAPHDRRILIQVGESHNASIVIGEYFEGQWITSFVGRVIEGAVAWQLEPEAYCFTCGGPCVYRATGA